jgi:hypothetical protein
MERTRRPREGLLRAATISSRRKAPAAQAFSDINQNVDTALAGSGGYQQSGRQRELASLGDTKSSLDEMDDAPARHRPGADPRQDHVVGHLHQGASRSDRRGRLLHRRGGLVDWIDPVPRLLSDRHCEPKGRVAGLTRSPDGIWTDQIARNPLDVEDGFLLGKGYLLLDRDPLCTTDFREALERAGVEVVRLPARSPNLNVFPERFVLSIKSECLERIVAFGERHLRRAVSEFVAHYHRERNHQGLEDNLSEGPQPANTDGRLVRRERLGGLLNFYHRAAA